MSTRTGYGESVDNDVLVQIVRAAGAPRNKGAPVLWAHKLGKQVAKGQSLYRIIAEHPYPA